FTAKHHALTVFLGIDRHHRLQRDENLHRHTTETGTEFQCTITNHQAAHSSGADIEHNLAVGNMLSRHLNTLNTGINHDIRSTVIIEDPFVQRTDQIGATGCHGDSHVRHCLTPALKYGR